MSTFYATGKSIYTLFSLISFYIYGCFIFIESSLNICYKGGKSSLVITSFVTNDFYTFNISYLLNDSYIVSILLSLLLFYYYYL